MRDTFFTHLAGNCNVRAAAESIGVAASQVYYRRKTSAPFALHWTQAIEAAYHLLETRMLAHVLAEGGETPIPSDGISETIDWDRALRLLTMHKARREERVRPRKPTELVATRAQSDAAILTKLKALADRKARAAASDITQSAACALPAPGTAP